MKKKIIILLVVVLGIGAYKYFKPDPTAIDTSTTTNTLRIGADSIYVANQKPNYNKNNELIINLVSFADGGYVVIHQDKEGGFGDIIGVSELLPSGDSNNVPLNLSEITSEGDTLYAMLHQDNGNKVFAESEDLPVTGNDGGPIYMIFTINDLENDGRAVSL